MWETGSQGSHGRYIPAVLVVRQAGWLVCCRASSNIQLLVMVLVLVLVLVLVAEVPSLVEV